MNQTIINAIRNKQCLSFSYEGHQRIIEPHAYGVSKKGKGIIRAFQTQGSHVSSHQDGWHIFSLEKMNSLTLSGLNFSSARSGYKKGDSAMSTIYAEL